MATLDPRACTTTAAVSASPWLKAGRSQERSVHCASSGRRFHAQTRSSGIAVGAPIDTVLAVLGGGYHRGESTPTGRVYIWPHLRLSLIEQAGRVSVARVASHARPDASAVRYASAEGLGLDSTASEIRAAFGEATETDGAPGWRWWIYRSRGVSFGLDPEQRVKIVDVFSPEGQR